MPNDANWPSMLSVIVVAKITNLHSRQFPQVFEGNDQ